MTYPLRKTTCLIAIALVSACAHHSDTVNDRLPNTFDKELASRVGADEYGMRSYVLVVLKTGPSDISDELRRKEVFSGHFSNMTRLAEAGKLVLAGPLIDAGKNRGIFILNVSSIEDAEILVETDPAVSAGIFTPEFSKYYGSAALMLINDLHKSVQEKDF